MFAGAVAEALRFTRPVGAAYRDPRAGVPRDWAFRQCASLLVNDEGWIVTSHHLIEALQQAAGAEEVPVRTGHGGRLVEGHSLEAADLHVARAEPFDPEEEVRPARFLPAGAPVALGAALCGVGCHPSPTLSDHYDEDADAFDPPDRWPSGGPFPVPVTVCGLQAAEAEEEAGRPEVVTPGSPGTPAEPPFPVRELLVHPAAHHGHSGGALVNWQGTVYGILLNLRSLAAGRLSGTDRDFVVSGAAPSETVLGFLDEMGVEYETEGWARKPFRIFMGGVA